MYDLTNKHPNLTKNKSKTKLNFGLGSWLVGKELKDPS